MSSVKHPRTKQILEDVQEHLDNRFSELPLDQQTIEDFHTIIYEMGPACDYAELLESQIKSGQKSKKKYIFAIGFAAVIILTLSIFLPHLNSTQTNNTITLTRVNKDKIDYPFVNDPDVIGTWKSVDLIDEVEDFKPGTKYFKGDLFLKEIFVLENGKTNQAWTWTKGLFIHSGDKTASKYIIKEIDGSVYMFFEWKSGDYTLRGLKPKYYVLKKE